MGRHAEKSGAATTAALVRRGMEILAPTSDSARLDAELLLGHVLKMSRAGLIGGSEAPVSGEHSAIFLDLIRQRAQGRPVAQLLGSAEFWSLTVTVTDDTLVPRPETELLVERALARLPAGQPGSVVDLGTGTGAVALAIATERPQLAMTATDISPAALSTAQGNAAALGIDGIRFRHGDWLSATGERSFDMIVSNPPYVADNEWQQTGPELGYEPAPALRAGSDGLDAIRVIVRDAAGHLEPDGWLLIEHGFRQGAGVRRLFADAGFLNIVTSKDLAGHPRVTEGQRGAAEENHQ